MNKDWNFYENLDEAVYVCDMDTYELEYLNRRCLQDCGAESLNDLKGKKCYEVLQKCSSPCAVCTNKYLKPGYFYEWKYTNPVLQKTYLLKDTMIERDGRRFRLELTVDVSAQERQNKMLQDYEQHEVLLNEGLRMALAQDSPEQAILVLLEHLGRYLRSERVYIFEEQQECFVTNTYEWCRDGIRAEKQNLQQIPLEVVSLWYRNFRKHENVIIPELEEVKENDLPVYQYLKPQNIRSLVVSPLFDNGRIIGFFGVDNAPGELLENISMQLEIIGYFITSLLKREALLKRLQYLSYFDELTGLKNRHAMNEYLLSLKEGESIGMVYLDVFGLKAMNDILGHQSGDRLIQRAGECLCRSFDGMECFRMGGDEFLVICRGITEQELQGQIAQLRSNMSKSDVRLSVGYVWEPQYRSNFEALLKAADAQMYRDKKKFYSLTQVDRIGL